MNVRRVLVALAVVVPLGLAACGTDRMPPESIQPTNQAANQASAHEPFAFTIGPAPGTTNLPISAEVETNVTGGRVASVTLTDDSGRAVAGAPRADGTSWVPAQPLEHGRSYTASVTAAGPGGGTETKTTTFRTMPRPGGTRVGSGLYLFNGNTYGAAMPVVVEFESDIPQSARASVARRLFVTTDPPQPGRWHWHSARMVLYRAEQYWQPGTTISVRSALAGHPIGSRFGDTDRSATARIADRQLVLEVNNASKQMTVYKDGQALRTMPVSLGRPRTPSSSGHMVIMEKAEQTIFDTTREDGPDGYRITIQYAQRLTWGGEYIHSAPWSVSDQGVRNVSHGCVNLSPANAIWLYQLTLIGDPVIVRGTERALANGNGWTAWNVPWESYGV
jgi:lipoprotein-anchoring transpeptidase ErfK/SrfK